MYICIYRNRDRDRCRYIDIDRDRDMDMSYDSLQVNPDMMVYSIIWYVLYSMV